MKTENLRIGMHVIYRVGDIDTLCVVENVTNRGVRLKSEVDGVTHLAKIGQHRIVPGLISVDYDAKRQRAEKFSKARMATIRELKSPLKSANPFS